MLSNHKQINFFQKVQWIMKIIDLVTLLSFSCKCTKVGIVKTVKLVSTIDLLLMNPFCEGNKRLLRKL